MKNKPPRKLRKRLLLLAAAACVGAAAVLLMINAYMVASTRARILAPEAAAELEADCVLVLGAGVWSGGVPSPMLRDRLNTGLALYEAGASDRLLMSGDHGRKDYDEVNVMKAYAVEAGVPSPHVFMDHAGFSTYESLFRARDVFRADRLIIVTQEYHLYRALYVARRLGLEAWGVAAEGPGYAGQGMREVREVLARNKDFFMAVLQPAPTYLGQAIPVSGDGDATND